MVKSQTKSSAGALAFLRDERFWQIALQVIVAVAVYLAFRYLYGNFARTNTQFGFSFFRNPAGFAMGDNLIGYRAQDSYTKVVQAGIINSLRVMWVAIITATVAGVAAGVASFSDNWLLYKISRAYVGLIRNIPLLLQLLFWYLAVFLAAPRETNQIVLPSQNLSWVVISNKGINLPGPSFPGELWVGLILIGLSLLLIGLLWRSVNQFIQGRFSGGLIGGILGRIWHALIIGVVLLVNYFLLFSNSETDRLYFKGGFIALLSSAAGLWVLSLFVLAIAFFFIWRWRTKLIIERGQSGQALAIVLVALAVAAVLIFLFAFDWRTPTVGENGGAAGGMRVTMEYAALVTGLTFYTGAFIAEIVRAGIQSVSRGQWEAARSVGLSNGKAMRLVVFPQALRVIIPPLNSEFANLAKNTSLALAIGFPDLYSVANTTFNQSGRPIEVFLVMMATYLTINLLISLNMNQLNKAVQFKER